MTASFLHAALAVVHTGAAAAWLGAMLYSLLVLQPRAASFFRDAEDLEDFTIVLAAGARPPRRSRASWRPRSFSVPSRTRFDRDGENRGQ